MLINLLIFMLMFLWGLISFFSLHKHLLSMLLSSEFLSLSLYFGIFIYMSFIGYEYFFY